MKRYTMCFLLVFALSLQPPLPALADSESTTATVEFITGYTEEPIDPVDPDKPTHGAIPHSEPEPAQQIKGATGAAGWLSINYVTPLVYGPEVEDGVYTVLQERPYLQTSDLRGTATGWKVTAVAGSFQSPEDGTAVPALLCFQCGSPNSTYHPYYSPPEIPEKIELPANGNSQQLIELAEPYEGVGIWVVRWYPTHGVEQDIQLRLFSPVPKGRLGFVLWIMNDAP